MAHWQYDAVDTSGRPTRGVVEAAGEAAARGQVRDLGLLPTRVRRKGSSTGSGRMIWGPLGGRKVKASQLSAATRQLSTLIGSDIPIEEALRLVAKEYATQPIGGILGEAATAVTEGQGFAQALDHHPRAFPEFYRASIAAGEQSGRLTDVLSHLTEFVAARDRAGKKVQLALLYPALLAGVSTVMIILLLIYVVPDIVRVFESRGAALPWLTRALIGLSDGLARFGLLLLALMALGAFVAVRWLAVPANALRFARWRLETPPMSGLVRQLNAARFAGTLATLVRSDVPLVDALRAAAAVTPNLYVRRQALWASARVSEGASLRAALAEASVFPTTLLAVVQSGERSGKLGQGLERAAGDLEHDLQALTTALVALVEPAVLVVMGGIVLLMVLAILMPIVNLNNLAGL